MAKPMLSDELWAVIEPLLPPAPVDVLKVSQSESRSGVASAAPLVP